MRSCACCSTAGFHHGSMSITREAATRLSATPPALRLIRNTTTALSSVKRLMTLPRASRLMLPSRRTHTTPHCSRRNCMISSMLVNCEKTMALAEGSSCRIRASSSRSASILVEDWKARTSMRDMMLLRLKPLAGAEGAAGAAPERSTLRGFSQAGQAGPGAPGAGGASPTAPPTSSVRQHRHTRALQHCVSSGSSVGSWQIGHSPSALSCSACCGPPQSTSGLPRGYPEAFSPAPAAAGRGSRLAAVAECTTR
mmetsp:Transcript_54236/g.172150  ORF Transcript_54236/g.172150 Transcript_54236/m.172150 type:complete len:254 (-) Transcript_54236:693-1454(-)